MKMRYSQDELNTRLILACQGDDLSKMKYLLTSPKLERHADVHAENDMVLRVACRNGALETVKYLLTSPEMEGQFANKDFPGLAQACDYGCLDIVKYLLASPELKRHANIHDENDAALRMACHSGHIEIVKYLLTSPEIKEHANLNAQGGYALVCAFTNQYHQVVNYLLYDMKMQTDSRIYAMMMDTSKMEELKGQVAKRDLFLKINDALNLQDAPLSPQKAKL